MAQQAQQSSVHKALWPLALLLIAGQLAACATNPQNDDESPSAEYDPWEPMNRKVYGLNVAIDTISTRPIAKAYKKVMPPFARRSVSNVFDNLTTPRSALNNFLQGKPARGFNEIGRFLFNSTIGIGGLIDIATLGGMERYDEDFSQTFAVWGLPEGPYIMLPIFGPHSLLDAVSLPINIYSNLQVHIDDTSLRDKLYGLRLIDARQRLLAAGKLLDDSQNPYITIRESYLQNREYKIYDGDPPLEDFYEFFDDE
ncbi:MAG: VacJ family lipoprotein [Proteobacteria bacterium]|nr:VacJ family lipoprotein [Pseudomonadota bacterium]